jgi:peptide/nickel transport system substrate-binding protein
VVVGLFPTRDQGFDLATRPYTGGYTASGRSAAQKGPICASRPRRCMHTPPATPRITTESSHMLTRRHIIAAGAALAAPSIAAAQHTRTLKFIPAADLTMLDPYWTPVFPTRNHAVMVYDTLFGTDADGAVSPQMLAGHVVEDDGKTWRLTLRDGLQFHDGTPVLGRDCVASIARWALHDSYGKTVAAFTEEMTAPDDKTIRIRLKRPFHLLPAALGKGSPSVCAIMPERLVTGDPAKPITEVVGSGPYRFVAAERNAGALAVYARFDGYVPRQSSTPSFMVGPKIVNFDRVEWHIISDPATAAAALQAGEIDWWELPTSDMWPLIAKDPKLTLKVHDKTGRMGFMRFNQLIAPFNNPAIRRALFGVVDQDAYTESVVGDNPAMRRSGVGYFCPTSPMASDAGMVALNGPRDVVKAKDEVKAAGYNGEKVVVLIPSNAPTTVAISEVGADMLRRCGFTVDAQYTEFGSMLNRLFSVGAADAGGWNAFFAYWTGLDQWDPAVNQPLRAMGRKGPPGWPDSPKIEALRDAWLAAPTLEEQKRVARDLQLQAFQDVPYIPLGQMFAPMAYRRDIIGVLDGFPLFWNVKRA